MRFKCYSCGETAPHFTRNSLCGCGGLYQLDFTARKYDPKLVDTAEWNIFRYRAFLPPLGEGWREVTLGEGMTATLVYREKLWFKLDYAMPTLSFKDRGAAMLIWLCKAIGVENVLLDSSGMPVTRWRPTVPVPVSAVRSLCRKVLPPRKSK